MIVTEKQNKELLKEMKETELILMGLEWRSNFYCY